MATNYRVMRCDRASGGRSHALLAYTPDHFLRNWWGGARFDDSFPVLPKPIEVGLKKSGVLPDLMLDAIPLMTPRLRLALESFGVTNIDYFGRRRSRACRFFATRAPPVPWSSPKS